MSSNWIAVAGAAEKPGVEGKQRAARTIVSATKQGTASWVRVERTDFLKLNPILRAKQRQMAARRRAACPQTQNRARESAAAPHYLPDACEDRALSKFAPIRPP